MEQLKIKYTEVFKALKTLRNAIDKYQELKNSDLEINLRDSVSKRFDYSVDSLWKYLKEYLDEKHGSSAEVIKSPKPVFKECGRLNFLSPDDVELALYMVDHRNNSVHRYQEEIADQLMLQVEKYYQLMKKCLDVMYP